MFKGLHEEIKKLNNSVKNVSNCQKAKALRKKLLCIGLPMAILGGIGVITCFILFATAGNAAFGENGFTPRLLIPFFLFIPCGIVAGLGLSIARLGFQILITGYTTHLVDEVVGNHCPNCKDMVEEDEIFCSACGTRLKIECSNCKTINTLNNKYCKNCGKAL